MATSENIIDCPSGDPPGDGAAEISDANGETDGGTLGSTTVARPSSKEGSVVSPAVTTTRHAESTNVGLVGDADGGEKKEGNSNNDNNKKIEMAATFWTHPSLHNIPSSEKRAYLHERGLTDAEIHGIWDHILAMERRHGGHPNNGSGVMSAAASAEDGGARIGGTNEFQRSSQNADAHQPRYGSSRVGPSNYGGTNNNRGPHYIGADYDPSVPPNQPQHYPQSHLHPPASAWHSGFQQQQQHHPYSPLALPPPTTPMMMSGEEDVEEGGAAAMARGVSLVAVGGLLGLGAAAAMRWLDGGEFNMFPPPSPPSPPPVLLQQQQQQHQQQQPDEEVAMGASNLVDDGDELEDEYYSGMEYDEDDDHDDGHVDEEYEGGADDNEGAVAAAMAVQERLLERIESLSQTIETQFAAQEKQLNRLSNASSVTDSSMNLLRKNNVASQTTPMEGGDDAELDVTSLLAQLNETKDDWKRLSESVALEQNGNRHDWQQDSTRLLSKLESCIEMVEKVAIVGPSLSLPSHDTLSPPPEGTTAPSPVDSFPGPAPTPPANRPCDSSDTYVTTTKHVSTPSGNSSSLVMSIQEIAENNDPVTLKVGAQLLYLYLVNLTGKPDNPRYRKIHTSSESFQKVEKLVGGKDLLFALGFEEAEASGNSNNSNSTLEWIPSRSSELEIAALIKVKEATGALSILKSGKPSDELTKMALSKLSVETLPQVPAAHDPPPPPSPPHSVYGNTDDNDTMNSAPQTPAGTSVVSPPMMRKKLSFATSSGTPANFSEIMEGSKG